MTNLCRSVFLSSLVRSTDQAPSLLLAAEGATDRDEI